MFAFDAELRRQIADVMPDIKADKDAMLDFHERRHP